METPAPPARSRPLLLAGLLLTLVLGLGSRSAAARHLLPRFVTDYAGDTLWATLVYLGLLLLWPRLSVWRAAAGALGFSVFIELSQLWHPPWLDALRANPFAALVLGRGFLVSDLVCYAAGVALGVALDSLPAIRLPLRPSATARGSRSPGSRCSPRKSPPPAR